MTHMLTTEKSTLDFLNIPTIPIGVRGKRQMAFDNGFFPPENPKDIVKIYIFKYMLTFFSLLSSVRFSSAL